MSLNTVVLGASSPALRSRLGVAAILVIAATAPAALRSQQPDRQCADPAAVGAGLEGGDACQKALDLFRYFNPQLGMLIAGGNATLGQGGVLGGLGRFSLTLRANATQQLGVPELNGTDVAVGPAERSAYEVSEEVGGFPVADVAIGLFKGFPIGLGRVGGLDALVNVFYIPSTALEALDADDFALKLPGGGLKLGYGVRVGVLSETRALPGVSVTYIQRALPAVSVMATTYEEDFEGTVYSDTISLEALSVRTAAWRVVAGKKLWIFAVAVGGGQDRYSTTGGIEYAVYDSEDGRQARGLVRIDQTVTRMNMFADLSINLFLFKLVGEIGRVSGGEIATYNQFSHPAGQARTYGAVGLRFGR